MILREEEAKNKLLEGLNKTVDVVKSTLGSKGKNVLIIDNMRLMNHITKDGVSVVRKIFFNDEVLDAGASLVKAAAEKTVNEAGDGTTTTSILTQSMCNEVKRIISLKEDTNKLCADLKSDLNTVIEYIKNKSKPVDNLSIIKNIAKVSSNQDEEISEMISNIHKEIGFDGIIDVRDSDNFETSYNIVKGYRIPNTGYASVYFINSEDNSKVEFNNPKVVFFNGQLDSLSPDFLDLFNQNVPQDSNEIKPLVLIVNSVQEHILNAVLTSCSNRMLKDVVIVNSNLIYKTREERFKDACLFLGAKYSEKSFSEGGSCDRIIIEKDSITFVNGGGNIDKHLEELKQIKEPNLDLKDRIFSLESKAAIINVGGKLQTEIKERKDRVEDAILAVRSAIKEGYCAGGSSTFLFAYKNLILKTSVMKEALLSCYKQLMINAGLEPMYYLNAILEKDYGFGFNVSESEIQDLLDNGIIDSCKVLRVSLENSVSTAITFATIDSVVY